MDHDMFDRKLAVECARAFSASTGLGCTISEKNGGVVGEYGYGCESCALCAAADMPKERCMQAHIYGMTAAERFGGKYIYFCPMGLTCFVSPIVGDVGTAAKITVGPFIMVDRQDYIDCELVETARLSGEALLRAMQVLEHIPLVSTERAQELSVLLFMSVGFMNNVSAENRMMEHGRSDEIQGQITSYIMKLKQGQSTVCYPFDTERALLHSIAHSNRQEAHRLLNELLGAILFAGGADLEVIKTRVYELLVLTSRTAVESGADPQYTLTLCHEYRHALGALSTVDALCLWLSGVINSFMEEIFGYTQAKHANLIHRCTQYIGANYGAHIALEEVARMVYVSPAHLSRIFKAETGVSFNQYLNGVRIHKAKALLHHRDLRMTDISQMVGYEDQSYFTKVFRRVTGSTPRAYREQALSR